jgi:hypothetical protein
VEAPKTKDICAKLVLCSPVSAPISCQPTKLIDRTEYRICLVSKVSCVDLLLSFEMLLRSFRAAAAAAMCGTQSFAEAQSVNGSWITVPDGGNLQFVHAIASEMVDGMEQVLLGAGGEDIGFSYSALYYPQLQRYMTTSAQCQLGLDTSVETVSLDPTGNQFMGGTFTIQDGCQNFVCNEGCLGPDQSVYSMVNTSEVLVFGGKFTTLNGNMPVSLVAAINITGPERSFNFLSMSNGVGKINTDDVVMAVAAVPGSPRQVLVGGTFSTPTTGTALLNNFAMYDFDTGVWSSVGGGVSGPAPAVTAIAAWSNSVYVAGQFTTVGASGLAANLIAEWNWVTQAWSSMAGGLVGPAGSTVGDVVVTCGMVFAAGAFTQAGAMQVNNTAAYDIAADTWMNLSSGIDPQGQIRALAVSAASPRDIYFGGYFGIAGGVSANAFTLFRVDPMAPCPASLRANDTSFDV